MDHIYHDFLGKVAAGRGKSKEEVRALAKGKVYSGEQALKVSPRWLWVGCACSPSCPQSSHVLVLAPQVGLVDQLGGLAAAIKLAKVQAGLPVDGDEVRAGGGGLSSLPRAVFPPSLGLPPPSWTLLNPPPIPVPASLPKVVVVEYPPRRVPLLFRLFQSSGLGDDASGPWGDRVEAAASLLLGGQLLLSHLLPAGSEALASGSRVLGLMAGVPSVRQALGALERVAGQAALLEGGVCMYSVEADVLSGL